MTFGKRLRQLRLAKNLTLRDVALQVGINFTYLSKIENGRLDFSDFPSERLICKLARALEGDADELLLMAKKVPFSIRRRVIQRPDAFRRLAALDDETLNQVIATLNAEPTAVIRRKAR